MARKFVIIVLSLATLGFLFITAERLNMTYNENDVYFDGTTTYDKDAIVGYGFIAAILLLLTLSFAISTWKHSKRSKE